MIEIILCIIIGIICFKFYVSLYKTLVKLSFLLFGFYIFLYSYNPQTKELNKMNKPLQVVFHMIDSIRHECRINTAKIIPLKYHYFRRVSSSQKKDYPNTKKSLLKLNKRQTKRYLIFNYTIYDGISHQFIRALNSFK